MKSQKEFVVDLVKSTLPGFTPYKDVALTMLSSADLENIKNNTAQAILSGTVAYGKDLTKTHEVISYARSMVMNHLKKARELNGGTGYAPSPKADKVAEDEADASINMDILPEDLAAYVKTL